MTATESQRYEVVEAHEAPSVGDTQDFEEEFQEEQEETRSLEITEAHSTSTTSSSGQEQPRISSFDAGMHLIKGNLGPGCLNLPHAFGLSGWLLGSGLFFVVAAQGIYSMYLLAECKNTIVLASFSSSSYPTGRASAHHRHHHHHHVNTFMDVAHVALGSKGQHIVQVFLFVLQTGVCCVFLSLIATNLAAQTGWTNGVCVSVVTVALLGIVLLRFLKSLRWLSTTANAFMFLAILTAAVAGISEVVTNDDLPAPPKATSNGGDVATFVSSMFFSFEGIGLVLPVENSFVGVGAGSSSSSSREAHTRANYQYRTRVLPGAMGTVGCLFLLIGLSASWGFPDNTSGSITAYLEERYPDQPWFGVVNSLVMVAVFLTFPLQLTPAMEVLEEWCQRSNDHNINSMEQEEESRPTIRRVDSSDGHREDALLEDDAQQQQCTTTFKRWWKEKEWIFHRYLVVLGCAAMVLLVDDLGLLMALFGAVGQTGLALMPCAIHLQLQRQGIAPKHRMKTAMDVFTIAFSALVMIFGLVVSVQRMYEKQRG
jgi:amino acid permease